LADLLRHAGTSQFGPAYQVMFENDPHAAGSVDRVLLDRMIRLCPETAFYLYRHHTPLDLKYRPGSRPQLDALVGQLSEERASAEDRLEGLVEFCASLGKDASDDLDAIRLGGTEEEIIDRGSDWCTDVARVACVLCQVAGLPARLVGSAQRRRHRLAVGEVACPAWPPGGEHIAAQRSCMLFPGEGEHPAGGILQGENLPCFA
jgi:transglutaminase-like putative cysteine protease